MTSRTSVLTLHAQRCPEQITVLDAGGSVLLLALVGACVPVCAYLAMLTVIAPFGLRRSGQIAAPQLRFRILVPAHDEAEVISRLLDSLNGMDYPRRLFSVAVVADNCRDRTASVAASAGADVFERHDEYRIGKGWALDWLLGQSDNRGTGCDAYVVIDADSEVLPNFLQVMNDRMLAGAEIVQAYYTVLRVRQTSVEALREASLALVHFPSVLPRRSHSASPAVSRETAWLSGVKSSTVTAGRPEDLRRGREASSCARLGGLSS